MGDRVVHHVELSLFPNWVGSDQQRWVGLAGDRLTLRASPLLLAGKRQVPRLVWERVDPPSNTRLTAARQARRITTHGHAGTTLESVPGRAPLTL
jgi:Lipocalin-like domain